MDMILHLNNRGSGGVSALHAAFVYAMLALMAVVPACATSTDPSRARDRVPVVAAFYPLYEFSRAVGGDRVEVTNLVASGAEPHDYDPSPRDVERIQRARLMVYIGSGFQPGLEKALEAAQAANLTVVDAITVTELLAPPPHHAEGDEEALDHDPHIWLDPLLARAIVGKVRDALIQADAAGKDSYTANAQTYSAKLDQLDRDFQQGLTSCARRDFITSHAAFAYLARRYSLTQTAISGLAPEAEPSPARLKAIVDSAREHQATIIFFETLVSPKVAEVVAREIGAKTLVLNPLEGLTPEEERAGKGYIEVQRQNLANLRIALECK